jgi:DNA-binding response OmpR family regulator
MRILATPIFRKQMKNKRILLVEDERDIADLLALHLKDLCDELRVARDGNEGMRLAICERWDLVVLDLRLPGPDGLEICRAIRSRELYTPVLMLTSKSSELDRVLGLELGADDYMTKPFSVLELIARVKAIFRREAAIQNEARSAHSAIHVGSISIDPAARTVAINDDSIELTAREFDLLLHFARHPGRVFRRAELLDHVWGFGHEGYEHTVNSHINRLRSKIEANPAEPACIVTVWGVGYKLVVERLSEAVA